MEANFPGFRRIEHHEERYPKAPACHARALDWRLASQIVRADRVRWAINSFNPHKAAGADGMFPKPLWEGLECILAPLIKIHRACIALGYAPMVWRIARVAFIPKAGRMSHTKAKNFRPISLTSFLSKSGGTMVSRYGTVCQPE